MRQILIGGGLTFALILLTALIVTRFGLLPVSADGDHSRLEGSVMPVVLHAAVARRASHEQNPLANSDANTKAGTRTLKTMCATCHGTTSTGPTDFGKAFYPPAPPLSDLSRYTDAEVFWIIKHGIRNTGMPAWGTTLSDEEIWQVVMSVKANRDHTAGN